MARLYLTEQHSILRKTGDRLIVEKEGEVLLEVPCLKLEAVLIYGNVQFTTQAVVELLEHGIELAIFSSTGRLWGQLTPPKARNAVLRLKQYELEKLGGILPGARPSHRPGEDSQWGRGAQALPRQPSPGAGGRGSRRGGEGTRPH